MEATFQHPITAIFQGVAPSSALSLRPLSS